MNTTRNKNARNECRKEARIMEMLSQCGHHPNVVQFIGYGSVIIGL